MQHIIENKNFKCCFADNAIEITREQNGERMDEKIKPPCKNPSQPKPTLYPAEKSDCEI